MRQKTLAIGGLLGAVTVATIVLGVVASRVSAQAGRPAGIHVFPVTNGDGTCHDMTNYLRADRNAWRAPYLNYMAGFMTGANFVSYSVPGGDSNVGYARNHVEDGYARADDAIFALLEQYCAKNPAKNISEAMMRVYSQLAKR